MTDSVPRPGDLLKVRDITGQDYVGVFVRLEGVFLVLEAGIHIRRKSIVSWRVLNLDLPPSPSLAPNPAASR